MANTAKKEEAVVEKAAEAKKPAQRQRRSPLDGARDILTVYGKDPNFVYRWVRNDEGRIQWFQERGYEVVTRDHEVGQTAVDSGSKLGSAVTKFGGGTVTLVLMRIPKEWYDEDQAAKEASIAATEKAMQDPNIQVGGSGGYGTFGVHRRR